MKKINISNSLKISLIALTLSISTCVFASGIVTCPTDAPAWNPSTIYNGGESVFVSPDSLCVAKWWTQGDNPLTSGQCGSWECNSCNGGTDDAEPILVGHYTDWSVYSRQYYPKNLVTSGTAEKLTHLVLSFGNIEDGECKIEDTYANYNRFFTASESIDGIGNDWSDQNELRGIFGQFRMLKQLYPDLKIIWSFGGWLNSGDFTEAAKNPSKFADSCYDLVNYEKWSDVFDGISIDWQYPNACGMQCDSSGFTSYRHLMAAVRNRFSDQIVAAVIPPEKSKLLAASYAGASQFVDFYMLSSFDYFGTWSPEGPTAPHAPLWDYNGIPLPGSSISQSLNTLSQMGIPANKIVMGVPFHGRGWKGVTQAEPGGTATGPATSNSEPGVMDYKLLKKALPLTGEIVGTAYAHCGDEWWSYDTPDTIKYKMTMLKNKGLAGAYFYSADGDTEDGELVNAMKNELEKP